MSTYKFGRTSLSRLATCHADIQAIMMEAIRTSRVDFGIAEGHRSIERQLELYESGKSRVKKGKHNYNPSRAVDVYAYYNGQAQWDDIHMGYLAGHILSVADYLLKLEKVSHVMISGGNWDNDGIFVYDHSFKDLPHFQI